MSVDAAYAEVERSRGARRRTSPTGSWCCRATKRRAIAAIYAFARRVDDVADGDLPPEEKRAALEELRAALDATARIRSSSRSRDARERFGIPREPLAALVDGGLQDLEQPTYADFAELRGYCEKVAGAVGLACLPCTAPATPSTRETLGIALQLINIIRDVDEDRQLGRVYLPQDELAGSGRPARAVAGVPRADGVPGGAGAGVSRRGTRLLASLDRRSALCVGTFAGLYRETLDRIEANGFDVFASKTRLSTPREARGRCARAPAVKVAVVGGGLAGLAAALDLVDAGAVAVLRGAADARRRGADTAGARRRSRAAARQRAAHRARLLHRVPPLPRARRRGRFVSAHAARAAGDRRGRRALRRSRRACRRCSATGICRSGNGSASRSPRCAALRAVAAEGDVRRAAQATRGDGRLHRAVLGRLHPAGAQPPQRRGRRRRRALHRPHGAARPAREQRPGPADEAARLDARRRGRGARSRRPGPVLDGARWCRSTSSMPTPSSSPCRPRESARLLGEEAPALEDSPIVSVHLWFDRPLLRTARGAARLGRALGLRPRRADRHASRSAGSTSRSSRAACPSCSRCAGASSSSRSPAQLTERLGDAELLWSRVSREPYATVALRPGSKRPGVETSRPNVVRAGTWTDTGWPATMESAVRSGRRAAQHILSSSSAKVRHEMAATAS